MFAKDPASQFTDLLIQMAESTMPKTHLSSKNHPKIPWFDDHCQKAIKERKKESTKKSFFQQTTLTNNKRRICGDILFKTLKHKCRSGKPLER